MKIQSAAPLGYFLLMVLGILSQTSFTTATNGVIPAAVPGAPGVPTTVIPLATSHQFVTRNWNRNVYVPTTTTYSPTTYYKYSGGYPSYPQYPVYHYPYTSTYQYTYPYYYPTYNYGYGYRGVW
ncbi:protein encore [Drosophila serrata]|uniref:protein encore n=1 Tax=Drosophila serrata TaxID=7274 RepID=UPI000A1D1AF0|nr:protein encore [Drosophila serrata]